MGKMNYYLTQESFGICSEFIAVFSFSSGKICVIGDLASCSCGRPPATPWLFVAHASWAAL